MITILIVIEDPQGIFSDHADVPCYDVLLALCSGGGPRNFVATHAKAEEFNLREMGRIAVLLHIRRHASSTSRTSATGPLSYAVVLWSYHYRGQTLSREYLLASSD